MEIEVTHKSIVLKTTRIRLREVQDHDFAILFEWRNTERFRLLFHHTDKEIQYAEFCEEFRWDARFKKFQFLAEMTDSEKAVGLAFIHSYSEEDKECFLNIFLSELVEKRGYGTDVFVLFVLFLFNQVGIEKLFVEASAYNKHSLSCIKNIGMKEVTGLNNKIILAGKEYDLFRFEGDRRLIPKLTRIHQRLTRQSVDAISA